MKKHNALRTLAATAVAVMTIGTLSAFSLPPTPQQFEAAKGQSDGVKEIVAFGDSFSAHAGKTSGRYLDPAQVSYLSSCATDKENWPKLLAGARHQSLGDWTCNGTGQLSFLDLGNYVESAINYGDLGADTKEVVIMYGGLDVLQAPDTAAATINPNLVTVSLFREEMAWLNRRVHEVAPNARITLASYPEMTTDDLMCVSNEPTRMPLPIPGSSLAEQGFANSLRGAAAAQGFNFVDVYGQSHGHSACNPDPAQRWTVGFADPAPHTMPMHPTNEGQKQMARIIGEGLS